MLPEVPLIVNGYVASLTLEPTKISRVDLVALLVTNVSLDPEGNPLRVSVTVPVNPLVGVMVTVTGAPLFGFSVIVPLDKASVNPGGVLGETTRLTPAVAVRLPEVPVIVRA